MTQWTNPNNLTEKIEVTQTEKNQTDSNDSSHW